MRFPARYTDLRTLIVILTLLTLWRVLAAWHAAPPLFFDEAQYWDWAQDPAWGYYSKPPMLAWLIALSTALLGDSELALRAFAFVLYPAGAVLLYASTQRVLTWTAWDDLPQAPFWAALLYATLPVVALGSWLITTDAALLFFWNLALWLLLRALAEDRWHDWLGLGLAIGAGLLSKYTMLAFTAGVFFWLLTYERPRLLSLKPYFALTVAALVFAPNVLWNLNHHFASFQHTAEISQLDRDLFNPGALWNFFAAQFAVFGPLLFAGLVLFALRPQRWFAKPALGLLAWLSLFPLVAFLGLALLSRAFANWAAFAYVAATPWVVILLAKFSQRPQRWLMGSLAIHLLIAALIYHVHDLADLTGITLTHKTDPYKRIAGWPAFGSAVAKRLAAYPDAYLLCTDREAITEALYYARPRSRPAYYWNLSHTVRNHYALLHDLHNAPANAQFVLIGGPSDPELLHQHFTHVEQLPAIEIAVYPEFSRRYSVTLVAGYRDPAPAQ